jgi:hypothetical protein
MPTHKKGSDALRGDHMDRTGEPDPASVVAEKILVSPKGRVYRIPQTDEVDQYEEPSKRERG